MTEKLFTSVSRQSLLTIYKSFARPILDYGYIIYDKPHKGSFLEKIERAQYNACLVITGAFKGNSRERLHQELGLESLKIEDGIEDCVSFTKLRKDFRLNT